jgi:hypothetical protein
MTVEELIVEGESMSRPCFLLRVEGDGEIMGYWGGERTDEPNVVPPAATALRSIRHIMTIDTCLLKAVGLDAGSPTIGFAEIEPVRGDTQYKVFETAPGLADLQCDGLPLHAIEGTSFPPFEAVCLYGGANVATWLKSLGLERHQYEQAACEPEAMDYFDAYMERSPIYQGGADVVIGGWHHCWAEDDFYLPLEMRLAAFTLRDAEPWYELWQATGSRNWSVKARIT